MKTWIVGSLLAIFAVSAQASVKTDIESEIQAGKYNTAITHINDKLQDTSLTSEQKAVLHYYAGQAYLYADKKDKAFDELKQAENLDTANVFKQTSKFQSFVNRANYSETPQALITSTKSTVSSTNIKPAEKDSSSGWLIFVGIVLLIGGVAGFIFYKKKANKKDEFKALMLADQVMLGEIVSDLTNLLNNYKEFKVDLSIRDSKLENLTPYVESETKAAQALLKKMIDVKDQLDALANNSNVSEDDHQNVIRKIPNDIQDKMNYLYENFDAIAFALQNNTNLKQD